MKHLFSLLAFIVFNTISHAQLSVRNNHSIFVNDEIVFVEDDLNLNETNSRVYLRNEAQLIQGSGITGNSGIGELSVYQEANVGAYEYNYWCSPIGSTTDNTINNPFGITLLNDVIGLTTSTPAIIAHLTGYNSTSSPLTIEPYWIWKFIASDEYAEWIHVRGTTTINAGEGFTMKGTSGSGDAQQYDFRGKPNNGTIAVSVANNQTTLVGNPYPSAIDAVSYIHDPQNAAVITGTLHFWEQDPTVNSHYLRAYDGGYATYTIDATGTVETFIPPVFYTYNGDGSINGSGSGSPSGKRPRRYIPIGQGFMVDGTATGFVRAKNSHRVFEKELSSNSEFFKTSNKKNKIAQNDEDLSILPKDFKRFRLNIDFNNTYTRQLVETFHESATDVFDYGLESKINIKEILASDAYLSNNNTCYLAEALNFDVTLEIPLTIKASQNMPIKIRITDIQNFDNDQPIYIHDIENDVYVNLRTQDFNINLDKGYYKERFEITFNNNSLSIDDHFLEDFKVFQNNSIQKLYIFNPNVLNIKDFSLFDTTGKQVIFDNITSLKTQYAYSTKILSNGIYIAKITFKNNRVFSNKIVVSNKN